MYIILFLCFQSFTLHYFVFITKMACNIKQIVLLDSADVLFLANVHWSGWRGFYQKVVIQKEQHDIKYKYMEKHKLSIWLDYRGSWVQIPYGTVIFTSLCFHVFTFDIKLLHRHALLLWHVKQLTITPVYLPFNFRQLLTKWGSFNIRSVLSIGR